MKKLSIKVAARMVLGLATGLVSASVVQAAPISVAVLSGPSANAASNTAAQLNDDTYFDFAASVVVASSVTSQADLTGYDVVVLGGSGFTNSEYSAATLAAVQSFMSSGGGVVTAGWYRYGVISTTGQGAADADFITPVVTGGNYNFGNGGNVNINSTAHAITAGVGNIVDGSNNVETGTLDSGATALGTSASNGQTAIAFQDATGRSAYLGLLYMAGTSYNTAGLRTGNADRLFEQAVAWASNGTSSGTVPEPGSLALAGLALVGAAAARRQRRA